MWPKYRLAIALLLVALLLVASDLYATTAIVNNTAKACRHFMAPP